MKHVSYSKLSSGKVLKVTTEEIEPITIYESPFRKGKYSRNIWDLKAHRGKIYIGQGNSSNKGVDPNAGPVPIYSLDPDTDFIKTERILDEEQIDTIKELNGDLFIPGHDSRESWAFGNFYLKKDGSDDWEKIRTIPDGIHVYDMCYLNGELFASLGNKKGGCKIYRSRDYGKTWDPMHYTDVFINERFYSIFSFKGDVYSVGFMLNGNSDFAKNYKLIKYNGEKFEDIMEANNLVPNLSPTVRFSKITRITEFEDHLYYIGASVTNDHQSKPDRLYRTVDLNTIEEVNLFGGTPMDILVYDNMIYVLVYVKNNEGVYENRVYSSLDGSTFSLINRYDSETFARSFEILDNDLYLGMGCYVDDVKESTGTIIRFRQVI